MVIILPFRFILWLWASKCSSTRRSHIRRSTSRARTSGAWEYYAACPSLLLASPHAEAQADEHEQCKDYSANDDTGNPSSYDAASSWTSLGIC
jgi:hypothetical protein